jgi:hypothetical protein
LLVNRYQGDAIRFETLLAKFGDSCFGISRAIAHGHSRVFRSHTYLSASTLEAIFQEVHRVLAMGLQSERSGSDGTFSDNMPLFAASVKGYADCLTARTLHIN